MQVSVSRIVDLNRSLLAMLAARLNIFDLDEEFGCQEFVYVSEQTAELDNSQQAYEQILLDSDSAFVATHLMLPLLLESVSGRFVVLEALSSARGFVQGTASGQNMLWGVPVAHFTKCNTNSAANDVSILNAHYEFQEPLILAPGAVLRAGFKQALSSDPQNLTGAPSSTWILGGFKVRTET